MLNNHFILVHTCLKILIALIKAMFLHCALEMLNFMYMILLLNVMLINNDTRG